MLITAVASLWAVLSTFVGAVIRHLVIENGELRKKVDASSAVLEQQSATQAKLIDAQQAMIALLQQQLPPKA